MPFKSKAQVRKFAELVKQGKISKREFNKWVKETPNMKKLPERAKARKRSSKKRKRRK